MNWKISTIKSKRSEVGSKKVEGNTSKNKMMKLKHPSYLIDPIYPAKKRKNCHFPISTKLKRIKLTMAPVLCLWRNNRSTPKLWISIGNIWISLQKKIQMNWDIKKPSKELIKTKESNTKNNSYLNTIKDNSKIRT